MADGRPFLITFNNGVDNTVKKILRSTITKMQNPCRADTVMHGKTYADKRDIQLTREGISFTASYQKIRIKHFRFLKDIGKIRAFTNGYDTSISNLQLCQNFFHGTA